MSECGWVDGWVDGWLGGMNGLRAVPTALPMLRHLHLSGESVCVCVCVYVILQNICVFNPFSN